MKRRDSHRASIITDRMARMQLNYASGGSRGFRQTQSKIQARRPWDMNMDMDTRSLPNRSVLDENEHHPRPIRKIQTGLSFQPPPRQSYGLIPQNKRFGTNMGAGANVARIPLYQRSINGKLGGLGAGVNLHRKLTPDSLALNDILLSEQPNFRGHGHVERLERALPIRRIFPARSEIAYPTYARAARATPSRVSTIAKAIRKPLSVKKTLMPVMTSTSTPTPMPKQTLTPTIRVKTPMTSISPTLMPTLTPTPTQEAVVASDVVSVDVASSVDVDVGGGVGIGVSIVANPRNPLFRRQLVQLKHNQMSRFEQSRLFKNSNSLNIVGDAHAQTPTIRNMVNNHNLQFIKSITRNPRPSREALTILNADKPDHSYIKKEKRELKGLKNDLRRVDLVSTSRVLRAVKIDSGYSRDCLIDRERKIIIAFTPRASCTVVSSFFIHHMGLYEQAKEMSGWIHNFRGAVLNTHKKYVPSVSDWQDQNILKVKVVRNPYLRAVSSYTHHIRTSCSNRSFEEYLKDLLIGDTAELPNDQVKTRNYHAKQQYSQIDKSVNEIVKIEEVESRLKKIDQRYGSDLLNSYLIVKRSDSHIMGKDLSIKEYTGDKPGNFYRVGFKKYRIPDYLYFYNQTTKHLVEQLYREDISKYGYSYPF